MTAAWLSPGEEIVGSWSVYVGESGPMSEKITGKLHVTNAGVHFEAGLALRESAAAYMNRWWSRRVKPFDKLDEVFTIPLAEIAEAQSVKKSFLTKALAVKLKSGEAVEFQFGAASPQKAAEAIASRL